MTPVPGRVPCLVRLELEVIRASEPALERLGLEVIREFSSVAVYALVRSGEEVIRGSSAEVTAMSRRMVGKGQRPCLKAGEGGGKKDGRKWWEG